MGKLDDIDAFILDCGCVYTPTIGMGVCKACGKVCCKTCLQRMEDSLLCPECLLKRICGQNDKR